MLHVWYISGLGDLELSLTPLTCVCKSHRGACMKYPRATLWMQAAAPDWVSTTLLSQQCYRRWKGMCPYRLWDVRVHVCVCFVFRSTGSTPIGFKGIRQVINSIIRTLSSFLPHMKCEFKSEFTKITLSSVFNILLSCVFSLHHRIIFWAPVRIL